MGHRRGMEGVQNMFYRSKIKFISSYCFVITCICIYLMSIADLYINPHYLNVKVTQVVSGYPSAPGPEFKTRINTPPQAQNLPRADFESMCISSLLSSSISSTNSLASDFSLSSLFSFLFVFPFVAKRTVSKYLTRSE